MIEFCDVLARKNFLRRADFVDPVARDADDGIGNARGQIQLVERHQNGQVFLAHHALENAQKLQLIADVEIACRLVEDDQLRLLAKRAGKQDSLPLAVADGGKRRVGERERVHLRKRLLDDLLIFVPQDAEPSRIGIAAHFDQLAHAQAAGLRPVGQHHAQQTRALSSAVPFQLSSLPRHPTFQRPLKTAERAQQRRLARSVGSEQACQLARAESQRKGAVQPAAFPATSRIADRKVLRAESRTGWFHQLKYWILF